MRKQDILRRLELFPGGENLDSGVDCTLKLGPPLDETISDLKTDKAMKAPNPSNMNFFYSTSPQVMQNYGVVKGRWNAYSGWGGISSSNHFTCFLDSERCNNNRVGLNSFGGSSSVKAPTNSNALNYFGGYLGFTPRPRNNVKVNSASQRRTEPEPTGSIRRCTACDTTSTPLWRNGPKGIKTLCNACGIRYKKEERRALGIAESYSKLKSSVKGRESTKKFWF